MVILLVAVTKISVTNFCCFVLICLKLGYLFFILVITIFTKIKHKKKKVIPFDFTMLIKLDFFFALSSYFLSTSKIMFQSKLSRLFLNTNIV